MPSERVLLSSIKTLNFYADEKTAARRSSPIPQLTCVGKPCQYYTPDAVQCYNVGGSGTDVSWKVSTLEFIPMLRVYSTLYFAGHVSVKQVRHILINCYSASQLTRT